MNPYSTKTGQLWFLRTAEFVTLLFLVTSFLTTTGCIHDKKRTRVNLTKLYFEPIHDGYDLNCPGRPWTEKDKKKYVGIIELSPPALETFKMDFLVKENRFFWSDPTLGRFTATFSVDTRRTQMNFWLVCTKKCKVKGNQGKGDDGHAMVYLKSAGYTYDRDLDTWTLYDDEPTPRYEHDVNCE